MALRLRVIGEKSRRLGDRATRVFGVHGGRIGRATDNDWVLPDPERFVSGHHATVEYRAGNFFLIDTSSNGTYVNGGTESLATLGPHRLVEGDRVRIGDYEFTVALSPDNDFPPDVSAVAAYDGLDMAPELALATYGDLGAEIDMKSLLADPAAPPDDHHARTVAPLHINDAFGQPMATPPMSARARATAEQQPMRPPPKAERPPPPSVRPHQQPQPLPPPMPRARPEAVGNGGSSTALTPLQAFCRGAGLDPAALPAEQANAVLAVAGQLLREMTLGMMEALKTRTEVRQRLQVSQTSIQPIGNNPMKFAASVDEALLRLFSAQHSRYLRGVDSVREGYADLKRHEQALNIALQDALAEFLQRFEPDELQQQFDQTSKRGDLQGGGNKARYWELYTEMYHVLTQQSGDGLPHAFAEEFAKAYDLASTELAGNARPVRKPLDERG